MTTLDRYILRAFLTNYVIALAVMIGLYVVLDLFVNLDEFTQIEQATVVDTFLRIVDYYSYNLFLYFSQLSGVILVVAACFTLGRFHRTNQLTAIMASGVSLYRVAAPLLVAGIALDAVWLVNQEVVIPRFADKLARTHSDIEGRRSFSVWFVPDGTNALLSAGGFNRRAEEMRGMLVMRRDDAGRMTEVLRADRARWDEDRQLWHLENGYLMRFGASGGQPVAQEQLGHQYVDVYHSELTPRDLALLQARSWTTFVNSRDLDRLQQRFAQSGSAEFIKVKHARLTSAIMNIVLLAIGISYFLNRERDSVLVLGANCLAVAGTCFVFTFLCQNLDLSQMQVNPALPAWLPVILFLPVAAIRLDSIKT